MNDYVAKPIRAEELVAALKRAKPLSSNGAGREGGGLELDAAASGSCEISAATSSSVR
jgi:DNA-binding response OmpR family regulator